MSQDNNILLSFYYPVCKEEGCNGTLKIAKNSDNLTIKYVWDKNVLHRNNNIKYNEFSNEYLKKQNYESKIEKCIKHEEVITNYCNECKKYICEICLKDCKCNNHPITPLDKYKLSEKQLNYLIKSLNDKKEYIKTLSIKIEEWKNELNKKLEEMKQELENEIKLIEKLILNYNKHFNNITYHKNIIYFKDRVYDNNNSFLTKFYNSDNFYEKTYYIWNYFLFSKSSKDSFCGKNRNLDYDYEFKAIKAPKNMTYIQGFIQIKNNYFFGIDSENNTANIYNYNRNEGLNLIYTLKDNEFYDSRCNKLSIDKTQIFLNIYSFFDDYYKIIILNLDLSQYKIELSSDKIECVFQKLLFCIELKKGVIAAVCEDKIIILNKINKLYKPIKIIKDPNLEDQYFYDLQIINNEFFTSFHGKDSYYYRSPEYVEFFDVETLEPIKKVKIKWPAPPQKHIYNRKIFIINDYLILTSEDVNKIILLSIKTKEIVQFFEIPFGSLVFIRNDLIIQIYQRKNYGYKMTNLKIEEGLLEYFDEKTYKIIQNDESSKKIKFFGSGSKKIHQIYYMDENEALYDLNLYYSGGFGILNNI